MEKIKEAKPGGIESHPEIKEGEAIWPIHLEYEKVFGVEEDLFCFFYQLLLLLLVFWFLLAIRW